MLGKLEKIDLREIWKNEALDFTNWLAKEKNMSLLSDEIGIEIQLIKTEANVGGFSADILAEEENTGRKIIIENQLEKTDHDHLGKLITYASGFDADILIWIFKEIREEHRKAIDWLNERSDSSLNIFAIKMCHFIPFVRNRLMIIVFTRRNIAVNSPGVNQNERFGRFNRYYANNWQDNFFSQFIVKDRLKINL